MVSETFCYEIFCGWAFCISEIQQILLWTVCRRICTLYFETFSYEIFCWWIFYISGIQLQNIMLMNILHFWDFAVKYSTNEHSAFLRFCCEIFYWRICTFCYKISAEGHFALLKKSVEGYFKEKRPKWLLTITFGDFKKWIC